MNNSTVPLRREDFDFAQSDAGWLQSAPAAPAPDSRGAAERHLRIASAPDSRQARSRRSPLVGALTAVGVILAIFAAQLGLSIAVSEGAYEARALQLELRDLTRVERVLSQNVDKLASPQNLAENAIALGMVQNATPATIRLSDAAVFGSMTPRTTAVQANLVSNATLENLPIVDEEGLLVARNAEQAAQAAAAVAATAVPWEGALPAPQTH